MGQMILSSSSKEHILEKQPCSKFDERNCALFFCIYRRREKLFLTQFSLSFELPSYFSNFYDLYSSLTYIFNGNHSDGIS